LTLARRSLSSIGWSKKETALTTLGGADRRRALRMVVTNSPIRARTCQLLTS
jgi:hypothetical protein